MRRVVGIVCFASFISTFVFAGYYVYVVMAPFFRGAEARYYITDFYHDQYGLVGVNPNDLSMQLYKNGVDKSAGAILRGVVTGERPANVERAWDALPQLVETWQTYRSPRPVTDIAWAAIADKNGRVVASYPASIAKKMGPVRKHTIEGWYGALGPGMQPAERLQVIPVQKWPDSPKSSAGSAVLARRAYGNIAVVPPGAEVAFHLPLGAILLISACSLVLFLILLPVWVAMDADWRGMRGGAWAVLVVVTGTIGFAAYLIARLAPPKQCPNCGETVHSGYSRCPACGVTLLARCPKCGRKLRSGWQFCPRCTADAVYEPAPPDEPANPEPREPIRVSVRPEADEALPSAARYALEVSVRDAGTGAPIPDATISIAGATAVEGRTGAEGRFEARALASDTYTVSVSARGFAPLESRAEIGSEDRSVLQLLLSPNAATVCGRVTDRASEQPIRGASVYLDSARLERSATADEQGIFALTGVPPGPYTICAEADGYLRQTRLADVRPGRTATVGFALEAQLAPEPKESADAT